jgi:hypothetical protein
MVSSTLHTCLAALWLAAAGLTASAEAQSFDSPKLPKLTPPTGQPMPELVVSYLQGGADDCAAAAAAAQIAGSGSFFVNSTLATTNLYNRDVWFVWTASADGTVFMGLCGTTPADTLLFAYPYNGGACPVQGAPSLAQNDDSCGLQSVISFSAVSGTSYYIAAASFQGSTSGYTAQLLVQETGASVDADECGGCRNGAVQREQSALGGEGEQGRRLHLLCCGAVRIRRANQRWPNASALEHVRHRTA